jgi:hypothetical protein
MLVGMSCTFVTAVLPLVIRSGLSRGARSCPHNLARGKPSLAPPTSLNTLNGQTIRIEDYWFPIVAPFRIFPLIQTCESLGNAEPLEIFSGEVATRRRHFREMPPRSVRDPRFRSQLATSTAVCLRPCPDLHLSFNRAAGSVYGYLYPAMSLY